MYAGVSCRLSLVHMSTVHAWQQNDSSGGDEVAEDFTADPSLCVVTIVNGFGVCVCVWKTHDKWPSSVVVSLDIVMWRFVCCV